MMLQFLLVLSQISFIAGFSKCRFSNQHVVITPSSRASVLHMAASDQNRPRVKVQRIVESLSSGMKSASEVELQLKALQADGTLLDLSTAVAGSLIGLISGGYFDAVLAHGDAPWAGPFLYAVLGGGAYYGAIQKTNADVSVKLRKYLGKPTLNAAKSSISKIQTAVAEAKASAVKKVEETVDDIVAIPTKIRDSFLDATDEAIAIFLAIPVNVQNAVTKSYQDAKEIAIQRVDDEVDSIVGAKDEAIANFIAIPVNIQSAATKSYQDAIQSAIQRVDDKVAEVIIFLQWTQIFTLK